jgi:hypothetical protein
MANLLAGLEFARADRVAQAQSYVDRAFQFNRDRKRHPAVLVSGLFKAATHPWHTAFRPHSQAEQTLDNLSRCLHGSLDKRRLLGYLHLYRALKSLRGRKPSETRHFLSLAGGTLSRRDLLDWRSARMMLSAVLRS